MKPRLRFALALALSSVVGCAHGALMTDTEIAAYGTKEFAAPMPKVFDATVGALKAQGYEIAVKDVEKGTIMTARKIIRSVAVGSQYSATAVDITRQYTVRLHNKHGATEVVAYPRVFNGEADISARPVWELEGPVGERALWDGLFRQIAELL
jgi:hypothetical protein